ncbi:MAG TPA: DUF302 domain-containing protein [Thermomicrobiales bacterium]|nr:DUF302 domain-containing protein [Thermomicrobiales bacterium]
MTATKQKFQYGIGIIVSDSYETAVDRTKAALKAEGFGVLTEIDVRATLKEKLDVDVPPYIILGACNPALAHRALQAEREIGLLLPCNVIVYEAGDGQTGISVMDPDAALGIVDSEDIRPVAREARERLVRVIESLRRSAPTGA